MINGRTYDYENIKVLLPSNVEVHLTEIKYALKRAMNSHHGKSALPGVGIGPKTFEGECTLNREGLNQLMLYVRGLGKNDPTDLPGFQIIVYYGNDGDVAYTDILYGVRFMEVGQEGVGRDSTNATNKFKLWIGNIDWAIPSPSL